ncbi:galactose oxidase [Alteromonas aestuariivivens]|uniref:Galactose oxidase n=1 Tax=Alteromonas aestuariivivens TaxID=1938339 RepID=A0A3D8MFT8_9ALTE|nr:kelch repeat-containing protein [Alteromonas aestuariivivens]RDV29374.1 galactose oxidase [Alteromonas aestuariivivens]
MSRPFSRYYVRLPLSLWCGLLLVLFNQHATAQWQAFSASGEMHPRHEAGLVVVEKNLYLLGGRRIQPLDMLALDSGKWMTRAAPPIELHHFQPVFWQDRIIIAGALTGPYPGEKPVPNIYFYFPARDSWQKGPEIPESRRRGAAGVVIVGDVLYLIAGTTNGHISGYVNWLDAFDLKKHTWQQLPDAPHSRDHFQAAVIGNKLYAAGGRQTSQATKEVFTRLIPQIDVFDLQTNRWSVLPQLLPTPRAGNSTLAVNGKLLVVGGESQRKSPAHNETEVYDPENQKWLSLPGLLQGRHGSGLGIADGYIWTASGSGARGGKPELNSVERMPLPEIVNGL